MEEGDVLKKSVERTRFYATGVYREVEIAATLQIGDLGCTVKYEGNRFFERMVKGPRFSPLTKITGQYLPGILNIYRDGLNFALTGVYLNNLITSRRFITTSRLDVQPTY